MELDKSLLGACGFYCGACPTYIKGGCNGCKKEHKEGDCFTLDCVTKKELDCCGACEDFPCETILTKSHATVLDREWLAWKKRSNTNK